MRYIKTNYLFGEIISHTKLLNGTHLFSIKDLDEILPISEEDFEKCNVADTIEELCDGFMIVRKDDIRMGGDITTFREMKLQRDCDIEYEVDDDYFYYGGIFTEKGFIYVAKMNDKGELELL